MLKPKDFNPEKKYPVLFYVYGGPGAQTVENKWGGHDYIWFQMMTQKGYIVVSVDNRGTSGRGEAFKKSTYLQMGKLETLDQIDAAKYLATLPYIDKDRLGMFGWSYGGYLTLLCMTKGADYFKMGIAVAPANMSMAVGWGPLIIGWCIYAPTSASYNAAHRWCCIHLLQQQQSQRHASAIHLALPMPIPMLQSCCLLRLPPRPTTFTLLFLLSRHALAAGQLAGFKGRGRGRWGEVCFVWQACRGKGRGEV